MPFYSYLTESERRLAYEDAMNDLFLLKLEYAFECERIKHDIRLNNIETELYIRECTSDEMVDVYAREMAVYTESVKDLWDKFLKFLTGIFNSIAKKLGMKPPETVEVEYEPKGFLALLDKVITLIKNILNFKNPDGSVNMGKVAGTLGIAGGIGVLVGVKKALNSIQKRTTLAKNKVIEFKNALCEKGKKLIDAIRGLGRPKGDELKSEETDQHDEKPDPENNANTNPEKKKKMKKGPFAIVREIGGFFSNLVNSIINKLFNKSNTGEGGSTKSDT